MRTTINIDDELLSRAKHEAAHSGRTLTAVIEDALREALARDTASEDVEPYRALPFQEGRGLRDGVDLDDSAALLELMDERE